jgi:hypothetical protein
MTDFAENSGAQEHDVDAIIAQAYGHSENPTSNSSFSSQESAPKQEVAPQKVAEPQYKEFEFNSRGQPIKIRENDPRFSQWLSQGHDYSQNIQTMKAEREAFERSRGEWEQSWKPYKEIDQFARQNPDWWNHIEQSYQQKLSTPEGVPDPVKQYLDQRLEPVAKDIPLMKEFLQEMQTQKMEKAKAEEDAKLGEAVKSIQTKYPNLDFSAKDESGLSLEHRVLNHAVNNGFPTFRAAFLDYYHDSLEKQAEARGKEAMTIEMNKRKRLGLLDDSPAPSRGQIPPPSSNRRPASWNDQSLSSDQILKEFKF